MELVALLDQLPDIDCPDAKMLFMHEKVRQRLLRSRIDFGEHDILRIVPGHNNLPHKGPVARFVYTAEKVFEAGVETENIDVLLGEQRLVPENRRERLHLDELRFQHAR